MEEQLFKLEIQPASWVMPSQAAMAKQIYNESLKKYREQNNSKKSKSKEKKKIPHDIVSYEIRMKGIEKFVTDPQFEKFWKRNGEYGILNIIGGLYLRYFGTEETGFYSAHPQITLAERNKELKRSAAILEKFCKVIYSDISLQNSFQMAFLDALKKGGFDTDSFNIWVVLKTLHESLLDPANSPCNSINTYAPYPRSIREKNKSERGRFIYSISTHLKFIHKRYNHALVSRILNVLRPDLGKFTPEDVRNYMTKKEKSALLDK